MNVIYLVFMMVAVASWAHSSGVPKSKNVRCAVCRSLVSELHHEMETVDPRRKVEVGSFRLEADGNQKTTRRSYAGSEAHMTDVLENVCGSFKDYAQATHKETGKLEVIAIVGKDGQMNPRFGEYDMIQDPDLNKSLEHHCNSIVEDHEELILEYFSNVELKQSEDQVTKSQDLFCTTKTKLCTGRRKAPSQEL